MIWGSKTLRKDVELRSGAGGRRQLSRKLARLLTNLQFLKNFIYSGGQFNKPSNSAGDRRPIRLAIGGYGRVKRRVAYFVLANNPSQSKALRKREKE